MKEMKERCRNTHSFILSFSLSWRRIELLMLLLLLLLLLAVEVSRG